MMRRALLLVWMVLPACKVYDALYCDEERPCDDPERPFCDIEGQYPASEGIGRTCIPTPTDAGPGAESDGGIGGVDADAATGSDRFVVDLAVGFHRSCAVLNDGALRCWGINELGVLGYPETIPFVGDDEHPFEVGDVPTGGPIKQVALAYPHTCVLYAAGNVRCFGYNETGGLGYGHELPVGSPAEADDVQLGEKATQIVAGFGHTCALLESGAARCWGGGAAALGYGDNESVVGDDEGPSTNLPSRSAARSLT
jgi:Regulator of chromosome condensation (RCC1) repeat